MIENRPDWVVSRQRAWGVPITVFVHRETGEILRDEAVNARIADAFEAEGRTPGSPKAPPSASSRGATTRPDREGHGHPRRLVRLRLNPRLRPREAGGPPLAGRRLPRRVGPAPRLVPLLAAGIVRHARPRAL
jgi:hypothetical protein